MFFRIKEGELHLKPSIIDENLPKEDGETKYSSRIEREVPTSISVYAIDAIEPLSEGYLEKLVKAINSMRPKKTQEKSSSIKPNNSK